MSLKKADWIYLTLIVGILLGLPFGISTYNTYVWQQKIPENAKIFHLTGHTRKGWILGEVKAADVLLDGIHPGQLNIPVLKVNKGDRVVLKLTSSDVIHGFSLKDFGIFINEGIHPGKPVTIEFIADKQGTFTFACNAICGSEHENMSGKIIVAV